MIQFRDTQPDGMQISRQATKTDLVDIARAIGVLTARDENSVDELRALIQTKLPTFAPKSSRQATKADLFGIAAALGMPANIRHTAEELRASIRAFLLGRVPVSDVVVETPASKPGCPGCGMAFVPHDADCPALLDGAQAMPPAAKLAPKPAPAAPAKPAEIMFHVPERPYSPIDSLNRRSAALGSPRVAQLASSANYNGHRVAVRFNTYRQYWTAEYFWAGRVVLGRGSFAECIAAALREHERGALGSSVVVHLVDGHWSASGDELEQALAACRALPQLVEGRAPAVPDWYTWRHTVAAHCARDTAHPNSRPTLFDWDLLQAAENEDAYLEALRAKHGRTYC